MRYNSLSIMLNDNVNFSPCINKNVSDAKPQHLSGSCWNDDHHNPLSTNLNASLSNITLLSLQGYPTWILNNKTQGSPNSEMLNIIILHFPDLDFFHFNTQNVDEWAQ